MVLFNSKSDITALFPNVFREAGGEQLSFFDKLAPFLEQAELWLELNLVDLSLLSPPRAQGAGFDMAAVRKVEGLCRTVAACRALFTAIPRLDIKLDSNGLATVGTQSLVPASAQRTERLMRSLSAQADLAASQLLTSLHSLPGWCSSAQFRHIAKSFIQDVDVVDSVRQADGANVVPEGSLMPRFSRFLQLRLSSAQFEFHLADCYFSYELMEHLRLALCRRVLKAEESRVVSAIRSQVVDCLNGMPVNVHAMRATVDFIRRFPDVFPIWHSSDTARLFEPCVFQNKKGSTGYFF